MRLPGGAEIIHKRAVFLLLQRPVANYHSCHIISDLVQVGFTVSVLPGDGLLPVFLHEDTSEHYRSAGLVIQQDGMDLFKGLFRENSHGVNRAIAANAVVGDDMGFLQFWDDGNRHQPYIDLVIHEHRGDVRGIIHHQLNIFLYRVLGQSVNQGLRIQVANGTYPYFPIQWLSCNFARKDNAISPIIWI